MYLYISDVAVFIVYVYFLSTCQSNTRASQGWEILLEYFVDSLPSAFSVFPSGTSIIQWLHLPDGLLILYLIFFFFFGTTFWEVSSNLNFQLLCFFQICCHDANSRVPFIVYFSEDVSDSLVIVVAGVGGGGVCDVCV